MSVHRVRLWHSQTGTDAFHGWLETWLTNMTPWDAPEVANDLLTLTDPIGGGEAHYQGDLAFAWSEDAAIIREQLAQYAAAYCEWSQLAYHVCTHDEDNPQPCSWGSAATDGTLPDAVPQIEVTT